MTGMGEDVYIDHKANREAVLDELVAESQRLGLYGDAPDHFPDASKMVGADHIVGITEMVEAACMAYTELSIPSFYFKAQRGLERDISIARMRSALESLGIPLSELAELKAGTRKAVRVETFNLPSGRDGRIPNVGDVFDAALNTPEEER